MVSWIAHHCLRLAMTLRAESVVLRTAIARTRSSARVRRSDGGVATTQDATGLPDGELGDKRG